MSDNLNETEAFEQIALGLKLATGRIPDGDAGVRVIAELVEKAQDIEIVTVPVGDLGPGLPADIPLIKDHRAGGGVKDMRGLIEMYRQRPERRRGVAKATTLQSFIDLTIRHKDVNSVIFAATAWPNPSLRCVVDYHEMNGAARYCGHSVLYDFPLTEEIKMWMSRNGKAMEQAEFAEFLEEHAAELAAPDADEKLKYEMLFKERVAQPNELIDLSRHLEVFVGAKVKRGERLSSGERTVEFCEEHTNGRGERIEIPGVFMICVPAFLDGDALRIPARLRYRIQSGAVHWSYQLYRPEFWLRESVQTCMAEAAAETGLPAYEGAPEAA